MGFLFGEDLAIQIIDDIRPDGVLPKRETRRLDKGETSQKDGLLITHVLTAKGRVKWRVGQDYAICVKRGGVGVARIKVLGITHERICDISEESARAEGFDNPKAFFARLRMLYGKKLDLTGYVWAIRFEYVVDSYTGVPLVALDPAEKRLIKAQTAEYAHGLKHGDKVYVWMDIDGNKAGFESTVRILSPAKIGITTIRSDGEALFFYKVYRRGKLVKTIDTAYKIFPIGARVVLRRDIGIYKAGWVGTVWQMIESNDPREIAVQFDNIHHYCYAESDGEFVINFCEIMEEKDEQTA